MGLDGVELILAFEEGFGIEISDMDAVRLRTPRDVIDLVASRVPVTEDSSCLEQRAFYLVRSAVREVAAIRRREFTPDLPITRLSMFAPSHQVEKQVSHALRTRFRIRLEPSATVRDLVNHLAASHADALKRGGPWTRDEIALIVKQLTTDMIDPAEYGEEREFVRDMGLDA